MASIFIVISFCNSFYGKTLGMRLTVPFSVSPIIELETVATMLSVSVGLQVKLYPESVILKVTLKDPAPGKCISRDPVRGVSPKAYRN